MKRIMILDDSFIVRFSMKMALEDAGYEAIIAAHGTEALAHIEKLFNTGCRIDLCVVDLNMPLMEGNKFITRLRKILPDIPIVVASSELKSECIEHNRHIDADACIQKPYGLTRLEEIIRQLCL